MCNHILGDKTLEQKLNIPRPTGDGILLYVNWLELDKDSAHELFHERPNSIPIAQLVQMRALQM